MKTDRRNRLAGGGGGSILVGNSIRTDNRSKDDDLIHKSTI